MGIWVIVKSVVIGFPIWLSPWVTLTPSLSRNTLAMSSLTMSMAGSGNPPTLWSKGVGACVSICRPLTHGFGFCRALMLVLGAS
jgi:hypothetical protein